MEKGPKLVFLGPTLTLAEASVVTDAVLLPPAVQGSIVAAIQQFKPSAILIVDGGFQTEPSVRHKEILWAIGQGIPVMGAASMGALRAAELSPLMQGVGFIYRWYRRFAFAPDDAVAVLHGPPEIGYTPLTDALIDLRLTVRAARRKGLIANDRATALEVAAIRLNFRRRTLPAAIRDAWPEMDATQAGEIEGALRSSFVFRKKADALLALSLLQSGRLDPAPPMEPMPLTAAFAADLVASGLSIDA